MKNLNCTKICFFIFTLMLTGPLLMAQNTEKKSDKPVTLKHWLTPEEAKLMETYPRQTVATDPPPGPI